MPVNDRNGLVIAYQLFITDVFWYECDMGNITMIHNFAVADCMIKCLYCHHWIYTMLNVLSTMLLYELQQFYTPWSNGQQATYILITL